MKFMVVFGFIVALFAMAMAYPQDPGHQPKLVGAEKCTWGPSYWCQSREIAEKCGGIQHCETKVWNKQ